MVVDQSPSVQKRLADLIVSDSSATDWDVEVKIISRLMDDKEFNLRQNYYNSIECFVHCIKNLKEQIVSKDSRIATLEDKLVQMSLELASAKAVEDHHQMLKRQISSLSISQHAHTEINEQDVRSARIADFAPHNAAIRRRMSACPMPRSGVGKASEASALCIGPKPFCSRFNSSWSSNGSDWVETASGANISTHYTSRVPQATGAIGDRTIPGAAAQRFSTRVMSGISHDTDESMSSISNESHSVRGTSGIPFLLSRCERSPIISKMSLSRQDIRIESPSRPSDKRRMNSEPFNRSFTARGLSNIGSILGLKQQQIVSAGEEAHGEVSFGGRARKCSSLSLSSDLSSRSCISRVVFPVSSNDCLRACGNDFKRGRSMVHSTTANEEWPSVQ